MSFSSSSLTLEARRRPHARLDHSFAGERRLLLLRITGAAERDVVAFSFAAIFASFDTLSIALIRLLAASLAPGLAQRALAAS